MNFLNTIKLAVLGSSEKLWHAGQDAWWRLTVLVAAALLFPLGLFLSGFFLAMFGEEHDVQGAWANWTAFLLIGVIGSLLIVALPILLRAAWKKAELYLVNKGVIDPPAAPMPPPPNASEDHFFHAVEAEIEKKAAEARKPSVAWPLVVLFLLAGAAAECVVRYGAVDVGKGLIVLSAFIAPLLLGLVLLRLTFWGVLVTLVRGMVPESFTFFPEVPTEEMKSAGKGVAGAFAVVTFLCLIVQGIAVWRYPGYMLGALTAFMLLAYAAYAQWLSGVVVKQVLPTFAAIRFVLLIAMMSSPRLEAAINQGANRHLGVAADKSEIHLLRTYRQERAAIQDMAAKLCGGKFCGQVEVNGKSVDASAARFALLGQYEEWLLTGSYWENVGRAPAPKTVAAAVPATRKVAVAEPVTMVNPWYQNSYASDADLAPPTN